MTKEQLTTKLTLLKTQLTQAQANANALSGAVQFCEILISELDTQAPNKLESVKEG